MRKFEFIENGKDARNGAEKEIEGFRKVGAWTDGLSLVSESEQWERNLCAFELKIGKTYKITIEEI